MLDEYLSDDHFFELAPYCGLWPNANLATLSGFPSTVGPYETNLIRDVEQAWCTPLRELSCEQVRELLGQRFGLQWLALPILEFVKRRPQATVSNYAGEMVLLSLDAAEEMHAAARDEFRAWLQSDFGWFEEVFGWDRELLERANRSLDQALRVASV